VLLRTAVAYLAIGAILAQSTYLTVRAFNLPPALFQAAVSLLLLGLPMVLIGVRLLEEQYGSDAALEALARSPWTSAPIVMVLGVVALLVGAGGWVVFPGFYGSQLPGMRTASTSVGFLPPRLESGDAADHEAHSQVHSALSQGLGGIGGMTLLPDSIVEAYRAAQATATPDDDPEPPALLVQETVSRSGDQTIIQVQVIEAATGDTVWSGIMNDPFRDVTSVTDELVQFLLEISGDAN
jgi:hypothetical protein